MSKDTYPVSLAALYIKHAGKKYRPSNGTEGEIFMAGWCGKCQRDKSMREGCDIDECDDNERCDIIANTMAYDIEDAEYPVEWQYGKDGQPCCTAFVEAGNQIPTTRCTATQDLFL